MGDGFPIPRLVVGLGNPGSRYRHTRHNIGFDVLDALAAGPGGGSWTLEKKWNGELSRSGECFLLKPLTYMNASGECVAGFARFHRVDPREILVVLDEVALPPGSLRLRTRGSAGGHNGLSSILRHLGVSEVPRLRLGVGSSGDGRSLSSHVLQTFSAEEQPVIRDAIARAVETVVFLMANGYEAAMNICNHKPKTTETQN
jgi:PTH1 family peptidyl-tRNA hydrolase